MLESTRQGRQAECSPRARGCRHQQALQMHMQSSTGAGQYLRKGTQQQWADLRALVHSVRAPGQPASRESCHLCPVYLWLHFRSLCASSCTPGWGWQYCCHQWMVRTAGGKAVCTRPSLSRAETLACENFLIEISGCTLHWFGHKQLQVCEGGRSSMAKFQNEDLVHGRHAAGMLANHPDMSGT